jgi:FMN phosphatase YigB (HAD superfamily)
MSKKIDHNIIIFDYGGVIADHHQYEAEAKLAKIFNVTIEAVRKLLSEKSSHGAAFREDKISESDFWHTITALTGTSNSSDSELTQLWVETYKLNENFLNLFDILRRQHKVAILTNIDRARSAYLTGSSGIVNYVDEYFPSYLFGYIKPKLELWREINKVINTKYGNSQQIIYFDDRQQHVDASKANGWQGYRYDGFSSLEATLRDLAVI